MVGYIPESSYNNKTREILDRYYPKAIQWCSFDDKPEGLVNIDICKHFFNHSDKKSLYHSNLYVSRYNPKI